MLCGRDPQAAPRPPSLLHSWGCGRHDLQRYKRAIANIPLWGHPVRGASDAPGPTVPPPAGGEPVAMKPQRAIDNDPLALAQLPAAHRAWDEAGLRGAARAATAAVAPTRPRLLPRATTDMCCSPSLGRRERRPSSRRRPSWRSYYLSSATIRKENETM